MYTHISAGRHARVLWKSSCIPSTPVDTGNLVKAMERTPSRVVFIDSNDEFDKILEHPFAKWRVFLHPAQRKIAYALGTPDQSRSPAAPGPGRR